MTPSDITIERVGDSPVHIEQALAVLQAGLGRDFISRDQLLSYAAPHATGPFRSALAATDRATNGVVGVLTCEIVDTAALRASFLGSVDSLRTEPAFHLLRPGHAGLIKSVAVLASYQGCGIASALLARGLSDLMAHGAERCYSLAWVSEQHGCQLCGVLEAAGFRPVWRIERFWYNDSVLNAYRCPVCGNPCVCAAQVMMR